VHALAALAATLALTAGAPFKATVSAPTHTPRVNTRWYYRVVVRNSAGRPLKARLTVQVVDPLGTAHPVQYDGTKQNIVNRPFKGVFRDYNIWPPSSRGFRLTMRVIVRTAKGKVTLTYWVKPR
jgi:hypothetical protein